MNLIPFLFPLIVSASNTTIPPFSGDDALGDADEPVFRQDRPTARFGRVIERYTHDQLRVLHPIISERLARREYRDEILEEFTPQFEPGHLHESTPNFPFIELDEILSLTRETVVFSVKDDTSIMVKYMHNCFSSFPHPLLTESWIEAHAESIHVARRVYFVSPPARMPMNPSSSLKTAFNLNPIEQMDCYLAGSTVRFVVYERLTAHSLLALSRDGLLGGVKHASKFALMFLPLLQALHKESIVHGDLAIDRVALVSLPEDKSKMVFINFSRASYTDTFGIATHVPRPIDADRQYLATHWELESERYTKRDDLFRFFQIVASIMDPDNYDSDLIELAASNMTQLIEWKRDGDVFRSPVRRAGLFNSIKAIDREVVKFRFFEIQDMIRKSPENVPSSIYRTLYEKFAIIYRYSIRKEFEASPRSDKRQRLY